MGADERVPPPRSAWAATSSCPSSLGHDSTARTTRTTGTTPSSKADVCRSRAPAAFLRRLHDAGLVVVLAASASEDDLADLRKVLDADDAIAAAVDADDVERSKPDPADLRRRAWTRAASTRARARGRRHRLDVRAARAAGMGCVAVESGGSSRHELAEAGAIRGLP